MLIKLCGITSAADANESLACGADWIGLNLVGGPRRLALDQLPEIVCAISDASRAVVLVNCKDIAADEAMRRDLVQLGIRRLQLYGAPSASEVQHIIGLGFEAIYVHHVAANEATGVRGAEREWGERREPRGEGRGASGEGLRESESDNHAPIHSSYSPLTTPHSPLTYILLDSKVEGLQGGTGVIADWARIADCLHGGQMNGIPVILAGGLTPQNVSEAVRRVRPYGVDVSSGVESAPGRKDMAKVRRFVEAVRRECGMSNAEC